MWAIIRKILHHPIPASSTMWELHQREMKWRAILWTTPSKYRGWRRWKFLDLALAAVFICRQHLANNILMKSLTQEQWRQYKNTTNCSICSKPFKSADKKVCNHDHLTGEYRGPAHNAWNFNYRFCAIFCLILQLFTLIFILVSNFLTLVSNMFLQICNFCFTGLSLFCTSLSFLTLICECFTQVYDFFSLVCYFFH